MIIYLSDRMLFSVSLHEHVPLKTARVLVKSDPSCNISAAPFLTTTHLAPSQHLLNGGIPSLTG
jgi:hypothetical protein